MTFIYELDPHPLYMYPQTRTFYVRAFESYSINQSINQEIFNVAKIAISHY